MKKKTYNFQNPEIQAKATKLGHSSARPKTYRSKRKIAQEVQKELIREELLKDNFIQQVGAFMPKINEALIASAMQPTSAGAADRKTIYSVFKILRKDTGEEPQMSIGQLIASIGLENMEN